LSITAYRRNFPSSTSSSFPHNLTLHNGSSPVHLAPTSVLLKIHAISLNYRDVNILNGTNPWPVLANGIPCSDAAAEVLAIGYSVNDWKVGDRVMPIFDLKNITGEEQERAWLGGDVDGVLATHAIFDEQHLVRIPEILSWREAACLPCACLTAWCAVMTPGKEMDVLVGKTVLIQGTGGVSLMALKIAIAAGAKVILSTSSEEKAIKIKERYGNKILGTVSYEKEDWYETVKILNAGKGVDVIVENGGASTISQSLRCVRKGGKVSQVGYLGRNSKQKEDQERLEDVLALLIDGAITLQ
jgi:NADPH:quinone reductase-like Zn-dependent oxidoreductase